ncbi:24454_t:CDS:2, partial [Entrophospora sp. SA101]
EFCRKVLLQLKNKKPDNDTIEADNGGNKVKDDNNYNNEDLDYKSGNSKVDLFIEETLKKSVGCNDFIEWIPIKRIINLHFLTSGGNSEVYGGNWMLPGTHSKTVVIKVLKDSKIINDRILNEFKIHYRCYLANNNLIIPFYGITYHGSHKNFAMILKKAEHGDLRNYLYKHRYLTWSDKSKLLLDIAKALNSIHQMKLVHKDFHCKNILVDVGAKIYIGDFGLCQHEEEIQQDPGNSLHVVQEKEEYITRAVDYTLTIKSSGIVHGHAVIGNNIGSDRWISRVQSPREEDERYITQKYNFICEWIFTVASSSYTSVVSQLLLWIQMQLTGHPNQRSDM